MPPPAETVTTILPTHHSERRKKWLTEAFRRAVLRLFVRLEPFDEEQAHAMLQWGAEGQARETRG